MGMIALVRADFLKQRHTSYWGIHTVIPIAGAILFVFYFLLYQNVDELRKLRLLLELAAMVFPLLISVIVGLNITQEERASHFQSLLTVPDRRKILLAKFAALYLSGIFSLTLLFILFAVGVEISGTDIIPWSLLIQSVLGLVIGSFVIYALHLLLSLKFGLGISLFWGVFECLQCILYSNVELHAIDATTLKEKYLEGTFDKILLDAPCSGLGVMKRKPEIKYHDSSVMDTIIPLQAKLLDNAYYLLKNNGKMVYSTCTINKKENEQMIKKFLEKYPDMKIVEERKILPFVYDSDGFYMCKLEKGK